MKTLIAILLFPIMTFAQSKFDYSRYTQVWVLDKDSSHPKYKTDENYIITKQSPFPISNLNTLSLYIPDSNSIVYANGNKYILSYLINFSTDTILIDRCDATIYPAETQIFVNSEWKTFQISEGSSCENSYFIGKLLPKSYYTLRIERPSEGNIQTKFRVKLKFGKIEYFSNAVLIKLTEKEIQKAGIPIKPFSI